MLKQERLHLLITSAHFLVFKILIFWTFTIINFVQLGFNLTNGVTDMLEFSSILIYFVPVKGIYTQQEMFD